MNHESRAALEARIRELEQAYQGALQENVALRRELEQRKQPLPRPHGGSTAEKIQLFRSLFRGRDDVYAVRWVKAQTGKSGYRHIRANLSLTHRIEVSVYEGAPEAALSMHANPGANRPD